MADLPPQPAPAGGDCGDQYRGAAAGRGTARRGGGNARGLGGLNAAFEQLSWFYVLDAWRDRWRDGPRRWVGLGVLLLLVLAGLIHALFWAKFLPIAEPTELTRFSIPLNLVLTGA